MSYEDDNGFYYDPNFDSEGDAIKRRSLMREFEETLQIMVREFRQEDLINAVEEAYDIYVNDMENLL